MPLDNAAIQLELTPQALSHHDQGSSRSRQPVLGACIDNEIFSLADLLRREYAEEPSGCLWHMSASRWACAFNIASSEGSNCPVTGDNEGLVMLDENGASMELQMGAFRSPPGHVCHIRMKQIQHDRAAAKVCRHLFSLAQILQACGFIWTCSTRQISDCLTMELLVVQSKTLKARERFTESAAHAPQHARQPHRMSQLHERSIVKWTCGSRR